MVALEELHGYSIDGVSLVTAVLPPGWRDRLVRVENKNTTAPGGDPRFTGWCLEPHDLCVAKLVALREKDTRFVAALLRSGIVDADVIAERLGLLDASHEAAAQRALGWLTSHGT